MKPIHRVLLCTLTFSILLEIYIRWISVIQFGSSLYGVWPPVDNVSHFFWGLNAFIVLVSFIRIEPIDALLMLGIIGTIWEFNEMAGNFLGTWPASMQDYFFFDGVKDIIVNLAGGMFAWWLFIRMNALEKFRGISFRYWMQAYMLLLLPLIPIGGAIYEQRLALDWTLRSDNVLAMWWMIMAAPASWLISHAINRIEKHHERKEALTHFQHS